MGDNPFRQIVSGRADTPQPVATAPKTAKAAKSKAQAKVELRAIAMVPLDKIQVAEERTRPLNPEHVQELQDSIAVVGLGQPLICDRNHHLIAGGHR
ncbi:MAG: ParB N-terminal domain-containing protein, partial [Cyanobacteria bacterium P01_H01_bin.121]